MKGDHCKSFLAHGSDSPLQFLLARHCHVLSWKGKIAISNEDLCRLQQRARPRSGQTPQWRPQPSTPYQQPHSTDRHHHQHRQHLLLLLRRHPYRRARRGTDPPGPSTTKNPPTIAIQKNSSKYSQQSTARVSNGAPRAQPTTPGATALQPAGMTIHPTPVCRRC